MLIGDEVKRCLRKEKESGGLREKERGSGSGSLTFSQGLSQVKEGEGEGRKMIRNDVE